MVVSSHAFGRWSSTLVFVMLSASCSRSSASNDTAAASSATGEAPSASERAHFSESFPVPSGPMLAILAGQGVGPIRFGATRATIERLMEAPCDVASETMCRYIPRAIEFTLDKGVVSKIRVHRIGRPATDKSGKSVTYGAFNGAIPPDLRMGMLPWAIQEKLGKPTRVEKVNDTAFGTEELHYYEGLTVEYDRMPNGNLVMGGVTLTKANVSTPPG